MSVTHHRVWVQQTAHHSSHDFLPTPNSQTPREPQFQTFHQFQTAFNIHRVPRGSQINTGTINHSLAELSCSGFWQVSAEQGHSSSGDQPGFSGLILMFPCPDSVNLWSLCCTTCKLHSARGELEMLCENCSTAGTSCGTWAGLMMGSHLWEGQIGPNVLLRTGSFSQCHSPPFFCGITEWFSLEGP